LQPTMTYWDLMAAIKDAPIKPDIPPFPPTTKTVGVKWFQ